MEELTTTQAAVAGGFLGTFMVCAIAFSILLIIACWRIFTKAGEKGWKSLIPIYNLYIAFKIVGMSFWGWFIAIFATSFIGLLCSEYRTLDDGTLEIIKVNPLGAIMLAANTILSIVVVIIYAIRLAKAFKKGAGFTIGLILLPGIFYLILAFGSAKYDKKILKK